MNKPKKIRLEVSSICQLKCPSCPTTTKAIHPTVGSGCLQLTDFQKLLNENPWIRAIELSNYGEIFLNPELSEIMREAFLRRIRLTADHGEKAFDRNLAAIAEKRGVPVEQLAHSKHGSNSSNTMKAGCRKLQELNKKIAIQETGRQKP